MKRLFLGSLLLFLPSSPGWTDEEIKNAFLLPELKDVSLLQDKKGPEYSFIVNYLQQTILEIHDRLNQGMKIEWQAYFIDNNLSGLVQVPVSWNLIETGIVEFCIFQRLYNSRLPRKMEDVIACIVGAFLRQWEYGNMAFFIAGNNSVFRLLPFSIVERCSIEHRSNYLEDVPFPHRMEALEDCLVKAVLSFEMTRIRDEFSTSSLQRKN